MKKTIVTFLAICITGLMATAQSIDNVKQMLMINQYSKAKEDLDKAMTSAKFSAKPEAHILKASIYAALAMDEANKAKPTGDQLAGEAITAFQKYQEMDKSLALLDDPIYQNAPANIYSYYYSAGYEDYTKKNMQAGFEKLQKAAIYSSLLIERKILPFALDTNLCILAGITAEQSGNKDAALIYYGKLADAKVAGPDFESIYRFLVSQYFSKKDFANFEKYKALGAELYPNSDFYQFDKIDFAIGLEPNFDKKVALLQEVLSSDPNNYKAHQVLGEIIYDTLNSGKDDAVVPANASELEKTMLDAFQKAAVIKPEAELSYLYMGDHFINKAAKIGDDRSAHAKAMQARTKPGTKPSADDVKKREDLDKLYSQALYAALEPYEKAAQLYEAKSKLDNKDKQQYRKVAGYLGDIYKDKKINATKAKLASDITKYTAEEKKWNDKYDAIK
ncbi:MAG: hypothetical protein RIR12_26 [Bacteroidota bacterium]|jgi:hypothetical protein